MRRGALRLPVHTLPVMQMTFLFAGVCINALCWVENVEPVKKPLAWLSKKFFLAAYAASSAYYWQQEVVNTDWRRLGGMIECDAGLIGVVSDTGRPSYLLALRAVPGTPLKRVASIVKVKNSLSSHKARIVIEDLGVSGNLFCSQHQADPSND